MYNFAKYGHMDPYLSYMVHNFKEIQFINNFFLSNYDSVRLNGKPVVQIYHVPCTQLK